MKGKRMEILCLGDSLTFGSAGHSYISYLSPGIRALNRGRNGDTAAGAKRRLSRYLRRKRYASVPVAVVWIGTNDLLIPHLATLSFWWKLVMKPRSAFKRCKREDAAFAQEYEALLDLLERSGKKAVLVGLPLIQVEGFPKERLTARNAVIQKLAAERNLPYVDALSIQENALRSPEQPCSWGRIWLVRLFDAAVMALFPQSKDRLAQRRNLSLTVDGVHLTSRAARLIAAEIEQKALLLLREGGKQRENVR